MFSPGQHHALPWFESTIAVCQCICLSSLGLDGLNFPVYLAFLILSRILSALFACYLLRIWRAHICAGRSSTVGPCTSQSRDLCAGYFLEGNYPTLACLHQRTWITTYMDSGFRISKTSRVNPALTLFTPRPAVTGMVKGQCLLFDMVLLDY